MCQSFNQSVADKISASPNVSYENLAKSMHGTASALLPEKTRVSPDWFSANKSELLGLIQKRNVSVYNKTNRLTRRSVDTAQKARMELKTAIKRDNNNNNNNNNINNNNNNNN